MGYFNIFYKITRIIDMLTRKRNRKIFIILLIIIAIVFLYHNKVNAQSDLDNRITDFMHIRADVYQGQIAYYNLWVGVGNYAHLTVQPVKESFTYEFNWDTGHALYFYYVSDLNQLITYTTTGGDTPFINSNAMPLIKMVPNSNNKFTYTCDNDGFIIIGNFHSDSSITNYNDFNLYCNTNYNGQSNLNTINEDLLRIETLLKDYLYGDVSQFNVSIKNVNNLNALSNGKFSNDNDYSTLYFKVKKGMSYKVNFNILATPFEYGVRFGYTNNIPSNGVAYINRDLWSSINYENTFEFTAQDYTYYYITYHRSYVNNFNVTSNYNEGQELGLYGGLTDINDQTRQQGEQTREVITSTDYNQSDVAINSDSVNNVDSSETDGLFTTIFTNFNNAATGGVDSITIPLPHNSGNLVLHSNLVSSHLGALSTLVSAFWYFVFGFYAFKFVNNLLHNIKDGSILDGFKNNNEVITQDML